MTLIESKDYQSAQAAINAEFGQIDEYRIGGTFRVRRDDKWYQVRLVTAWKIEETQPPAEGVLG